MSNSEFISIPVNQIIVNRNNRQRQDLGDIQPLVLSIKNNGVINPIIINKKNILIAGERRLESCKIINPEYLIPVRYIEQLPEDEQLLEYEENAKRKELDWKENALAVYNIHSIMEKRDLTWNTEKTGELLGYSQQHISKLLNTAKELLKGNINITQADTLNKAVNTISRHAKREADNIINSIFQPEVKETANPIAIECSNFIEWIKTYTGEKFNFLHCDLPYGVNHNKSAQGGITTGRWEGYNDSEDIYWQLLKSIASNIDNILLPNAHIMFWFSMKFYRETIDFFLENTNLQLVTKHPLIWLKSEGLGIVPDSERGPRQTYETALLFSRGDRRIIKPVANGCFLPSNKSIAIHVSEKPEAVLKHFFQMFVDNETVMLDPTCGSGSAIRAAASMGAKIALGLEINPDFAKSAQGALNQALFVQNLIDPK